MASSVRITLDNYINNVCYAGQTLSGKVECSFNTAKTIRAIRIKFKGKAKTKWTRGSAKHRTTYCGKEYYFNEEYDLISGGDLQIEAGRHSYPFAYILPASLPSTFEGKYGAISYTIQATVDRPWKTDYEDFVEINVCSPLDLNNLPEVKRPYGISLEEEVSSGCCRSDPLIINISLPATGFAEDQDINIGTCIQNMSNVTVEHVKFKLIQSIKYISQTPYQSDKTEEFQLADCTTGAVGAHGEKSWTSTLSVPRSNFSNLIPCAIIDAYYYIEIKVILPFPNRNISTIIPIQIGTIPLLGINMGVLGPPPEVNSYPSNSNATAPSAASTSPNRSSTYTDVDIGYPPDNNPTAFLQVSAMRR